MTTQGIFIALLLLAGAPVLAADGQGTAMPADEQHDGHDMHEGHDMGSMPDEHEGHAMESMPAMHEGQHGAAGSDEPAPADADYSLPPPTPAEQAAAFPDLGGLDLRKHMRSPLLGYVLVDQLEWLDAEEGSRGAWDVSGWVGYDFNRIWYRSEGERAAGEFEAAELQLLYGRAIARWWELVAGVRQDFEPGPSRTFAAIGIQGLAPYWFETELTLYAGEGGQTGARLEAEYELLLTNRLILQPLVELNAWGRNEPERGVGAGLSTVETGLRLRYEIRREFAPYIGLGWERSLGNTADLIEAAGGDVQHTALLAGLRLWW